MRYLGIDYGTKKTGLAMTDEAGTIAFPHTVIPTDNGFLDAIETIIIEHQIDEVVVGESRNLDGTPNPVQEQIDDFITDLTLRLPIPIHLQPEQLTTRQASTITGKNDMTDAAAAAIILDTYIQANPS